MEFTREELEKKYKGLPEELRKALDSTEVYDALRTIVAKHGLHIDQSAVLEDEISLVLLGIVSAYDFTKRIKEGLGLSLTETENIVPWLSFFFKIILEQSKRAIQLLSEEEVGKLLSSQQQIIWNFISKAGVEITPLQIFKNTNIPRPTINQALVKLLRLKWIERIGLGRGTRYKRR